MTKFAESVLLLSGSFLAPEEASWRSLAQAQATTSAWFDGNCNRDRGETQVLSRAVASAEQLNWDTIKDQIIEWGSKPEELIEDGILAPSPAMLAGAWRVSGRLQRNGCEAPSSIALNGEGGVVFTWRRGNRLVEIDLQMDGTVELLDFDAGKLINRQQLQ